MENPVVKRAIIIGASSGLGKALAIELARRGYRLGLTGRNAQRLEEVRARSGPGALSALADVRDGEASIRAFQELVGGMGGCDLLVLSAGIGLMRRELLARDELDVVEVNVTAFTRLAVEGFNLFLRQGHGHLVGLSSIAALRGGLAAPAYCASKAYEANYLEGLRLRAFASGKPIQVTTVQPGFVHTPMTEGIPNIFWASQADKAARQMARAIERKRDRVYVTRRWALVALVMGWIPFSLYKRVIARGTVFRD